MLVILGDQHHINYHFRLEEILFMSDFSPEPLLYGIEGKNLSAWCFTETILVSLEVYCSIFG